MKSDKIKNETMLRIRDLSMLEKLQEMYKNSNYSSVNEFLNGILKTLAFKESKEDEILEKLESIENYLSALWEKLKNER